MTNSTCRQTTYTVPSSVGSPESARMQTPRSGNATNRRPSRGEDAPGSASKAARRTGSLNGPAENTLGERVKVVVRVRPPRGQETGGAIGLDQNGTRLVVFRENSVVPQSEFEYDQVLPPSATQADVYQAAVQPIVADVMNGYNGTIMAFGQTGAGKTYTLSSIQPDAIGMMPRAGAEIFEEISADPGNEYTVFMSYIQIYMELIQDLLRPENENLQIRESENGVFVAGVQEVEVKGMQDCLHLLQIGDRNRVVAFTNLNAHSSRSHAIVMLTVIKRRRLGATSRGEVQKVKVGKLFIVDLAGSERLKKSRSTGLRATEAKSINLSLTTLGMCINARADPNSQHVPFRDSKLTRLLQESLGGNAKTSLVIAVANAIEHVDESLQTLQFGARAMCVKTQAVINERVDYKLVSDLTSRLDTRDERTSVLEATLMSKEEELENLHGMLKGEQAQNAQVIQALQRERQLAEEEKERLLAQRNAELEAERLHKEQLAMQLQDTQAQAEDLLSMHEAEKSALLSELGYVKDAKQAAERDKDETIRKLENDLTRMQHQHALEQERLSQQLTMEREAALHRKQLELEAVQQKLRLAQEEGERLQAEGQRLRVQYEEASYQSEERWKARLQESESSAQRRLEQEQGSVAQLRSTVAGLEADVRELTGERNRLEVAVDGLGSDKHQLQEVLSALRRRAAELERHNAAMARSRSEFEQAWTRNKRLNQAARVIQAEYRRFRVRQLQRENMAGAQALWQARQAGQSLEDQKAAVEAARHAHLAWSGRALVANSMVLMQEGIETIRAAFLLPQKDLKQVSSAQAKLASLTGTPGTPRRQGSSAFGGILTPRGDSGSWSIASAGSAYGGGSPFITPMGTPRLGSGLGKSGLSFASPGVGSGHVSRQGSGGSPVSAYFSPALPPVPSRHSSGIPAIPSHLLQLSGTPQNADHSPAGYGTPETPAEPAYQSVYQPFGHAAHLSRHSSGIPAVPVQSPYQPLGMAAAPPGQPTNSSQPPSRQQSQPPSRQLSGMSATAEHDALPPQHAQQQPQRLPRQSSGASKAAAMGPLAGGLMSSMAEGVPGGVAVPKLPIAAMRSRSHSYES